MTDDRLKALTRAAHAAWTFALPLIEISSPQTRRFSGGAPVNTFAHGRDLVDHTARDITTPNNDTLYSSAHIDLSQGPVTLRLPANADADLDIRTGSGGISTDFPVTMEQVRRNELRGRIGAGTGGRLRVSTGSGGVRLERQ